MGWKLRGKPVTTKVTRKLASEFAEMDPAPHDRKLSERRLQVYNILLNKGEFRPVTWAKAYCKETEGWYRVNGKHTSILLSGMPTMPEFFVTIEEYDTDTLEDVAKLYSTFDSKMQSRTANDIYLSFAATVPELKGLPVRTITVSVAGMNLWEDPNSVQGGNQKGTNQPADRAEMLLEHSDFVVWLDTIFRPADEAEDCNTVRKKDRFRHLHRSPVVAAMFGSWQKDAVAATAFWNAVRDGTGTVGKPDRKLNQFLLTTVVGRKAYNSDSKNASEKEMLVRCIHSWNAWRRGEKSDLRYYPEAKVPEMK